MISAVALQEEWQRRFADAVGKRARMDALPVGHPDDDLAVDEACAAEDWLIEQVRAPGIAEVLTKLQVARRRYDGFEMPDDVLNAIADDLSRLAAE